jgi:hypothetical protein
MTLPTCPNCESPNIVVRPAGRLQPFFVKRVFGIEPPTLASLLPSRLGAGVARLLGGLPSGFWLGLHRPLQCDILICEACDFAGPALPLTDDQLLNLYRDYRTSAYDRERIRYEPSYRKIAPYVGKSPAEDDARMAHVEAFLAGVPGIESVRNVLDFAGADGRFIPPQLRRCKCTVYEVSDQTPCRTEITKAGEMAQLGEFDYIQVCHLLEHVLRPKQLMESIIRHCAQDGLVYMEVPREATAGRVKDLRIGGGTFPIHEHVNLYTEKSLAALVEAVGLKMLKIGSEELDLGWCHFTTLSAVAARVSIAGK